MSYIIFTDGSSRGNPGLGGYGAIISNGKVVHEIGGKEEYTTNNRMEMTAVIEALKTVSYSDEIKIFTDSAYVVNGITKWVYGWQKNNWQTKTKEDVLNVDLWKELVRVCENKKILWQKVSGHAGVPANERCDVIATSFADGVSITLFHGLLTDYGIDLSITKTISHKSSGNEDKTRKKTKAYSYISMVDGKIQTHETWCQCEDRVKGKSGARFKKSVSEHDEANIIAQFESLG